MYPGCTPHVPWAKTDGWVDFSLPRHLRNLQLRSDWTQWERLQHDEDYDCEHVIDEVNSDNIPYFYSSGC